MRRLGGLLEQLVISHADTLRAAVSPGIVRKVEQGPAGRGDVRGRGPGWDGGMFVALKDIGHAKGRFTLMIGVIALLTLLLVLLTGLTRGLAHQNISAIEALPADRIVLTPTLGEEISWSDSQVDSDQDTAWEETAGL